MFKITCFNCLKFRERILNKATSNNSPTESPSSALCLVYYVIKLYLLALFMLHWSSLKRCHEIKRCLLTGRKAMTSLESTVKSRDISTKRCRDISTKTSLHLIRTCQLSPYSQICGFSSSHVRTGEWDHKEGWAPKNWCFQTVMLEKNLEKSLR